MFFHLLYIFSAGNFASQPTNICSFGICLQFNYFQQEFPSHTCRVLYFCLVQPELNVGDMSLNLVLLQKYFSEIIFAPYSFQPQNHDSVSVVNTGLKMVMLNCCDHQSSLCLCCDHPTSSSVKGKMALS